MMNVIGDKRRYRAYKARVAVLPEGYREAVAAFERYLLWFGPGDADAIQRMLDDLGDLFVQSAADGLPLGAVVGDEPVEFAETFLRNYPEGGWMTKERDRLTAAVGAAVARG